MEKNDNEKNRLYVVIAVLAVLLVGAVVMAGQYYLKNAAAEAEKKSNDAYARGVADGQASALSSVQSRILQSLQQNGYVDFSTTLDNNKTVSERLWAESVIRAQLGQGANAVSDTNSPQTAAPKP